MHTQHRPKHCKRQRPQTARNACRFSKTSNNTLNFLGNKTIQKSQITAASKQWFECNGKRAANLFGHDACIRKESGEKEVSLRTIAQDLTSFSKFDHSGYWWDVTQV